ncbi:hypothetical protein Pmani_012247 [Petrolisthes manimaculis]|uniref:Rab11 family-interacting protein 1 n=1 Tax=Petrolisthes manimaculis TaxID=1843537 RepID=A0AAE1PXG4_9EUCA|nr:hypothetical protein Pmani_012247 [Petrolisthes manimaculis]
MWQPTHLQVTVQRARNINYKGKNDTNDAFVVIALGKDKFQTSIKDKATSSVEWHEECELAIPTQGNTALVSLTVYHRNALGLDEFLGQVQLPLSDFDVYERPRNRWHRLKGKPEKDRKKGEKERGELEFKVAFTVKSGSLLDVSNKKDKNKSITSLKNLGGSLMSLGNKEKANLKSFAKSVSHRIDKIAHKPGKKKNRKGSDGNQGFPQELGVSRQHAGDADPGVISDSDEDDFGFDEEVRVNTGSSSPYSTVSRGSSLQEGHDDDVPRHNGANQFMPESRAPPKPARLGGNVVEVPTISLESPVPTPSPQPSPPPSPLQPSNPPTPPSTSTPLTFPNLTPINLSTNNNKNSGRHSPRHSTSSDSAMTLSLSSSLLTKDTGSIASSESSPEPTPLNKEIFPDSFVPKSSSPPSLPSPPPRKIPPKTVAAATTTPTATVQQDVSPFEPPQQKEAFPDKLVPQDTPSTLKPVPFIRSTSVNETASMPSSGISKTDQSLKAPIPKNRSLSTSAAPKIVEKTVFSFPSKESSMKKGSALAALASATSKLTCVESEEVPSSPAYKTSNSELTFPAPKSPPPYSNGVDDPVPPTPSTPSASVCSMGSGSGTPSGPATPLDSSCGPSPAPTSRSFHGTPGLAERPGATVVRSGSLHEKPTTQPVIDEWERKLYGRNAMGSMENVNYSESRSSLNTSRSSSTQDIARIDEHGSRFPEIKALKLEKKTKEDNDEGDGKKRRGKGGGLKSKLFGSSSRERIGEEDGRVVEGGNDRLPHPPTHQSRLPREIHDKFAGKSREDLMEMIVGLQSTMEKNVRHARDLEDYIDDLLLRVMESTPQLLQASATQAKHLKIFGL